MDDKLMHTNKTEYCVNHWRLDLLSGVIIHQITGERKRLGEYQLKLLDVLIQHAGQTLSREELTALVWERRVIGSNSLPNAIHALRIALEDDGKQQRVIKTIPKKGYILEAEYCGQIERKHIVPKDPIAQDDEGVSVSRPEKHIKEQDQVSHSTILHEALQSRKREAQQISPFNPIPLKQTKQWFRHPPLLCVLLLAISGWAIVWLTPPHEQYQRKVKEQQANAYSNIKIYQIVDHIGLPKDQDKLLEKLKDTLYKANQNLHANNVQMHAYYHISDTTLNFTLLLKNACHEQQLAMRIYHWRLNNEQLNKLIDQEIERKLHEMDICTY